MPVYVAGRRVNNLSSIGGALASRGGSSVARAPEHAPRRRHAIRNWSLTIADIDIGRSQRKSGLLATGATEAVERVNGRGNGRSERLLPRSAVPPSVRPLERAAFSSGHPLRSLRPLPFSASAMVRARVASDRD